jgi:predicted transcriptional regulator YheO
VVFLIKGSIDQLANTLQVSGYTIYNYLEGLKAKKNENS